MNAQYLKKYGRRKAGSWGKPTKKGMKSAAAQASRALVKRILKKVKS